MSRKIADFGGLSGGSLKRVFILSFAALYIVTTGAAVGVFYFTTRAVAEQYVTRFAASQNLMERNRILAIVDRDATLSLKLSDDPFIQAWMKDETDPQVRATAIEQLESYRALFRDRAYFVGIADSLSYYVHTQETGAVEHMVLDRTAPHDRWFFETLQSDQDFWINVDFNVLLQEIRVWINSLVRDRDGTLLGVAGTGMDLSGFLATLVEHNEEGIATIIVNREGQILGHRDRSIIEHNAGVERNEDRIVLETLLASDQDRETMRRMMDRLITTAGSDQESPSGPRVETAMLEVEGTTVTAAVGFIPEVQWFNLVLVEGGMIMGIRDFLPLIQVSLLSLLVILVAVVYLLNRLVLRPLERLSAAADQVAVGGYDIELDTGYNNEIGRLSKSFIDMTRKIREYTTNLEEMVADRTRALQETQDRIMESIRYGRLIQFSIMPSQRELTEHLEDYFFIQKPLDTVGGDFSFFRPMPDGFCLAVIDCTGHGVPGAFMTMLVSTVLNRVAETAGIEEGPADMLKRTHRYVQDGLRTAAEREHLENGMDIALCRYRSRKRILEFSGAGLPLLHRRDGELSRVDGARVRLGYASTERDPEIPQHTVFVTESSVFYLFTDGVLDLPGGERGFGLGMTGLIRLLSAIEPTVSLKNQRIVLEGELDRYRGTNSARDDMMVMAFVPKEGT